jgi:HEAT repeat protein
MRECSMKNALSRWLFLLLLGGFTHGLLADNIQDQITALKNQDSKVRSSAAIALGKLADARAVEPLIACLKDTDLNVRASSAFALGKLGDARAVAPLIACLKDKDLDARGQTVVALGKLGDARAVEPLYTCMKNDQSLGVRKSAAAALDKLGKPGLEPHP